MSELCDVILYCDAGFKLYEKLGGYGIHGYTYTNEVPKRGTGNPKAKPTNMGYQDSATKEDLVSIKQYVDLCGPLANVASSNEAELKALLEALKYLDRNDSIENARIFSDSRFTVQGISTWITRWVKSNWRTSTGNEVKYKELWMEVKELWDKVKSTKSVEIEWIKGHSGHIGNDTADELATRGTVLSLNGEDENVITKSDAPGYWTVAASTSIPRLLEAPRFYVITFGGSNKLQSDGSRTYYLGTHGGKDKDDDMICKPYACNYMAVVRSKIADPIMDTVIDEIHELEKKRQRPLGTVVVGNNQNLLSRRVYRDITQYGLKFMRRVSTPVSVSTARGLELASELVPLGRGYKLLEICSNLNDRLVDLANGKDYFTFTDLGEHLFEEAVVKKVATLKVKASITSSVKSIRIDGNFSTDTVSPPTDTFIQRTPLILGSDLPSRNQLVALVDDISSIQLASWRDSSKSCRYGTYIVFKNGDCAFWSRYDANLLIVKRTGK